MLCWRQVSQKVWLFSWLFLPGRSGWSWWMMERCLKASKSTASNPKPALYVLRVKKKNVWRSCRLLHLHVVIVDVVPEIFVSKEDEIKISPRRYPEITSRFYIFLSHCISNCCWLMTWWCWQTYWASCNNKQPLSPLPRPSEFTCLWNRPIHHCDSSVHAEETDKSEQLELYARDVFWL